MEKSLSKLKLILTGDGSHSLFREDLKETYHSIKGAVGESTYVYIEQGISTLTNTEVSLFEVGFGTGLNALLTNRYAIKNHINVSYHTLEPYPLEKEIYSQLGYALTNQEIEDFDKMHAFTAGEIALNPMFSLNKYQETLENFRSNLQFDIIYFDAFAPSRQPEIWSKTNLRKCYDLLRPNGILVTYCAQGQFKRDLKEAGFEVETLKGAMGKKEMVRGIKKKKELI